jgi:DNA primase
MYDRDAIIAAVELRSLADELLGPHVGGERNPAWRCPNPQHTQTGRTPPVNVFTSHRGEQRWRCHGCGDGGTAIDLVMACRGVDLREAMHDLADRVGQGPRPLDWEPRRPVQPVAVPVQGCRDTQGLTAYVDSCERVLWRPEGSAVRRWLTEERGLPVEVLHSNHVGADLGPRRQRRPDGMCRMGGAVLPVIAGGEVVYAQVRVPHPRPDRPRYLNPTADLASNPRLARFRPPKVEHSEVIVTEGAIDALSAASAGYRAVAVLSAGYPDRSVAHALSRLPHPLVIAFDPDDAGRQGADRLAHLLEAELRPSALLDLGHGDVNDALRHAQDWGHELPDRVHRARSPEPLGHDAPSVSR